MKMHQPPQNFCKYAFPDWCRNELGSKNNSYPCLTAFIMTEAWLKKPKIMLLLNAKNEGAPTTSALLQISLP